MVISLGTPAGTPDDRGAANRALRCVEAVLRDTDLAVRTCPAKRGLKKGGLAKLVEEAVRRRVLDQTVAEAMARNAKVSRAALEAAIDKSVAVVRAGRTAASKR